MARLVRDDSSSLYRALILADWVARSVKKINGIGAAEAVRIRIHGEVLPDDGSACQVAAGIEGPGRMLELVSRTALCPHSETDIPFYRIGVIVQNLQSVAGP